jgi:hypothetical protein
VELVAKVVRHWPSLRFVFGKLLVTEGAPLVKRNDRISRRAQPQSIKEHPRETEDGVGCFALGGTQVWRQRVIGPVHKGVTINQ